MALRNDVVVAFARACLLRCPRCGGGQLRRSWLHMRPACPTCALTLNRGETADYWYGGFLFNMVAAELLCAGLMVVVLLTTYPDVPWTALEVGTVVLAVVAPVVTYPWTRCLWLAWDLVFRPSEPGD